MFFLYPEYDLLRIGFLNNPWIQFLFLESSGIARHLFWLSKAQTPWQDSQILPDTMNWKFPNMEKLLEQHYFVSLQKTPSTFGPSWPDCLDSFLMLSNWLCCNSPLFLVAFFRTSRLCYHVWNETYVSIALLFKTINTK